MISKFFVSLLIATLFFLTQVQTLTIQKYQSHQTPIHLSECLSSHLKNFIHRSEQQKQTENQKDQFQTVQQKPKAEEPKIQKPNAEQPKVVDEKQGPPQIFSLAFKTLKVKQPKLYDKLQKGTLTHEDQQKLDEFLLDDKDFVENILKMVTSQVPEKENCLLTLKLSDDKKSSLASHILQLIDWNTVMKGNLGQPTDQDLKDFVKAVKKDQDLGPRIGKCVQKIQKRR